MPKLLRILVAFLTATLVFAALHGVEEFHMAFNDEHPRPAMGTLLKDSFFLEIARAIPFALPASSLLSVAAVWFASALRKARWRIPIPALAIGGGILGAVLSVIIYVFVGGWGPPFFFEHATCGATLGAMIPWLMPQAAVA